MQPRGTADDDESTAQRGTHAVPETPAPAPQAASRPVYGDEPTQYLGQPGEAAQPRRLQEEPPPTPPDSLDQVRENMRIRKRGPVRRLTLYASGVDTRVLMYAPIEETEYVIQGSMVILTAIVAALSAVAASSFLIYGKFTLSVVTILIGLAWGLMIFFFDRALVSGSFNPYHFTSDEVRSLADRRVASPWAHVALEKPASRGREFLRVLGVGSLRIALALATSYIVADMVLFLVFQPEVNARAAFIQQELAAQRVASIQSDFATESAERAKQREQLSGASDPEVIRQTTLVDTLTEQLDNARKDLSILQAAAAAELDGDKYEGTLSDGTVVKTTGNRGNGAAAQSLAARRNTQQARVNDLQTRLNRARTALDARIAEIKKINAPALATLDALDNKATADQQASLAAAATDPQVINGLLLRKNALTNLEYDAKPETLVKDEVPPCTGLFAWPCEIRNAIVPPTPMGPTVLAYRMIFFFIEIMPITFKMINSLRRRRPYEMAKAALEEATHIDAFRMTDRHLYDASKEVSARAYERRAWRETQTGEPEPLLHDEPPPPPVEELHPIEPVAGQPAVNPIVEAAPAPSPDGPVYRTDEDGTVYRTDPDGTVYRTDPDGTAHTVEPDGTAYRADPDGTTHRTETDGTVYRTDPDGTVHRTDPTGPVDDGYAGTVYRSDIPAQPSSMPTSPAPAGPRATAADDTGTSPRSRF